LLGALEELLRSEQGLQALEGGGHGEMAVSNFSNSIYCALRAFTSRRRAWRMNSV
jgi:hypothetical protein